MDHYFKKNLVMMAFLTIKQAGKCKLPCGAEQIEVININYRGCEGGRQTDIGGVKHLWIQVNEWEATRKTVLQKKIPHVQIDFSSASPLLLLQGLAQLGQQKPRETRRVQSRTCTAWCKQHPIPSDTHQSLLVLQRPLLGLVLHHCSSVPL